ncbi:zinc-binding alcohol dehydrogenase family protein [Chitinophaga filiformis]|uniref:zinc-binding alcohol dehydrogenase family protein n=1 Tax=Chitinophaga filiformis TaxID=104663 RepID=UPI001F238E21|nr:zinc-binding alcohol dehydrogenase family protein [Chitinophaga filiformis]MCF6402540.1 zinc-binding alcohol dehydrogenase family protein [Chitinophaga filiformis]MCF6403542.1 zinc-binding alcohol dehydrogenase family protein [Chitinophaga filiformis]
MRAAVLYYPGGPENFILEQRPVPVAGDGQVLIKVKAFGLNRSELMTRKGLSPSVVFPRVLGIECVGEVENDPAGVFKKGEKVAAFMGEMGRAYDGSYAEYAVLPGSILTPFHSHLSWEQLGAIPEMFQTVYGSLHLALGIKKNETLLIRGGTSSIGMLATQIAKKEGLYIVATTRKPEKEQLLLDNGVDEVLIDDGNLSSKVKASFPAGIDKILELVGTGTLKDSLQCAAQGGTVCMAGMLSEQWSISDFAPMEYIPATVRLTMYSTGQIRVNKEHFQAFIRDVEAGNIKLNISCTFKLDDIAAAHRLMDSNSADGKIVVVI